MPTDTDALFTHLGRFRRRAVVAIFVRTLVWTAGLAVFVAVFLPQVTFGWMVAAAGAVTTAITAARVPSRRATAVALDRVLHLQDHAITAVHCAPAGDAFSQLVVRDAIRRLAPVGVATAFPWRIDRAALIAPILAGLVAAAAGMPQGSWLKTRTAPVTAIAGAPNRSPATTRAVADSRADATAADAIRERAARDTTRNVDSTATNGTKPSEPRPSASITSIAGTPSAGAAGLGRGASTAQPSTVAGGVAGGTEARDAPAVTAPADATYPAAYRAARIDAEAAIVRDRIPPERRTYVRQYFHAIRPQDQK